MKKRSRIVYAITRGVNQNRRDEFFAGDNSRFTFEWRLADKHILRKHVRRTFYADDMPIGYLIPLEDDDA